MLSARCVPESRYLFHPECRNGWNDLPGPNRQLGLVENLVSVCRHGAILFHKPVSFPLRLERVDPWERIASRRRPAFSHLGSPLRGMWGWMLKGSLFQHPSLLCLIVEGPDAARRQTNPRTLLMMKQLMTAVSAFLSLRMRKREDT